jgi:SAM-dependent methyltransferase
MSHQGNVWEKEYRNPKLVTKKDEPQKDVLRFFKFLKKEHNFILEDKKVLDLGCGTGRNSNYIASLGNSLIGIEISKTAISLAKERASSLGLKVDYRLGDIGEPFDIPKSSVDLVLDVTSSNSLNEKGRKIYLEETHRVLKDGGFFFVRALAKDGNKNVKFLLKNSPGKEYDTYIIKEMGLTERVFSRKDFIETYEKYFKILYLEKKTSYTKFNDRVYKRDYWLAGMKN